MSIHRPKFTFENFTAIPNEWVRDPKLTAADKGVLTYIMSHTPGYDLTVEQMVAQMRDGPDAIASSLKRLETAGYMRRERRRYPSGKLGPYNWHVQDPADQSGNPATGSDQQEQDVSAGGDQSGKTSPGKTSLVKAGSKKTMAKNTTSRKSSSAVASSSSATAAKPAAPRRDEDDDEARERRIQKRKSGEARKAVAEVIRRLDVTRDEANLVVAFLVAEATESGDPIRNVAAFVAGCPDDDLEAHLAEAQCRQEPVADDSGWAAEAGRVRMELGKLEPGMDDIELDTIAAAHEAALRRGCGVNDVIRTVNEIRDKRGRRSPTAVAATIIAAIKAIEPESDAGQAA
jgi:hypothetical protein